MNALQKLSDATRMLAEIRTADDAKKVMDIASAAEHYARKHKLGEEAISHAHAISIEAHAMLGQFWKQEPKHQGGRGNKNIVPEGTSFVSQSKEIKDGLLLSDIKEEQPEEFEQIKSGKKKITQVRRERTRTKALGKIAALPTDKFRVIYADPPWKYGDERERLEGTTGASAHYPSMTISELSALPIGDMVHDDAVLFLWVTSPLLFECEPVFKAWGFSYKSAFIWDKVRHNMGHYNSVRHELLLICTRGSCLPDVPKLFDSVQSIERTAIHSEKPQEFRSIIDTLYPHGERLELFARCEVPTPWQAWGSEVTA